MAAITSANSNKEVAACRPQHLYGVDHRLAYPLLFAMVEWNSVPRSPPIRLVFTEGLRTSPRQVALKKSGATTTLNSKHLIGLAADVAALGPDGVIADIDVYQDYWDAVRRWDADYNGKPMIRWGGDWHQFKDGCHFEL